LDWVEISGEAIDEQRIAEWALRDSCGAVVTFSGRVRESSTTGHSIVALEYETSEHLAREKVADIIDLARRRWESIEAVAVHHRVGRVELGQPAVFVAVSAPHRGEAFAACQFCIDALKTTVPMWKREIWEGGSHWSQEATPIVGLPSQ
jgi:molybdopterin synthase catalytic subunit